MRKESSKVVRRKYTSNFCLCCHRYLTRSNLEEKRFILANSLRECSQSRWSSHSSKSNSRRHWWKLAHIWMGQEADRRLETKMDYEQKVLPQSDPFPLSRHCLPKTHTPPHLPQTAPQLEIKHPIGTYRNYFTSKLDKASTPLTFCWGQVEEGRELRRDNSHDG